jgi:hypothetical protein
MMKRALVVTASLAFGFVAVRLGGACLDVTPIFVDDDAFDPDAGCLLCLQQPSACADIISSCEGDLLCKPTYACMVALGCLDLRTIDDKIKCGLACAQDAGITSVDDPTTAYLINLVACGRQRCTEPCNLVDANIGL